MSHGKNKCSDNCKCVPRCAEEKCCKPQCVEDNCDRYSGYEICCQKKAAVVQIDSLLTLSSVPNEEASVIRDASQLTTFSKRGNGAFICKHLILTTSSMVIAPPTAFTSGNSTMFRFPGVTANDAPTPNGWVDSQGQMPNDLVRFSKILVTVNSLNGRQSPSEKSAEGHTFVYEASVLMVDGAGGWALLYINPCLEANRCMPKIKECHPFFEIANSRKLHCGDDIFLMGVSDGYIPGSSQYAGSGIVKGIVSNDQTLDYSGSLLPEIVKCDANVFSPSEGLPMIDKFGRLVAIQMTSTSGVYGTKNVVSTAVGLTSGYGAEDVVLGHGYVAGISTNFMEFGMKAIFALKKNSHKYDGLKQHLVTVYDSLGAYYKFAKGYAGISYKVFEPKDYFTYSYDPTTSDVAHLLNPDGMSLYDGPKQRNLAGITVLATSNSANGDQDAYLIPHTGSVAPFDTSETDSSFSVLERGDVLTAIETCHMGGESRQIAPALLTWQLMPGDTLSFTRRKPSETMGIVNSNHLCDPHYVSGILGEFPAQMDYPWAVVNNHVLVANVNGLSSPLVTPGNAPPQPSNSGNMLPDPCFVSAF